MRILFLDVCAQFLNPTRGYMPELLCKAGEVCFFGPGHVSTEVLFRGLHAFVQEEGPFDIILMSPHVLFARIYPDAIKPKVFNRSYVSSFREGDLKALVNISSDVEVINLPRLGVLLESDYFNWTEREISELENKTDALVAMGEQFFLPREKMVNLPREHFAGNSTDVWFNYASHNGNKIANMLHIIGEHEFNDSNIKNRPYAWSVMGVDYYARSLAAGLLEQHGINWVKDGCGRKLASLMKKIIPGGREQAWVLNYLNSTFLRRLASARYSYTCGSGLDLPVRKFFEIPATGTVLTCRPFAGFEAAGFIDRQNAVVCEPEDIVDAHRWLESDQSRAQHIADAGRAMVIKNHSVKARSQQFKEIIRTVVAGTFSGGKWEQGTFKVTC